MVLIKYVCSLGGRCHTASLLKECSLKKASYPFDWIFSNLNMIIHCIQDDFNIFLNKDYYNLKNQNNLIQKQNHSFYCETECEPTFNHHNPLNIVDHQYFQRCCKRFKNLLSTNEFKLFFTMFLNYNKIDDEFISNIINFKNELSKYTCNFGIVCIVQYVGNSNYYHFTKHENIHFLEVYTLSKSDGKEFENKNDNDYLNNIITSTYKFDLNEIEKVELDEKICFQKEKQDKNEDKGENDKEEIEEQIELESEQIEIELEQDKTDENEQDKTDENEQDKKDEEEIELEQDNEIELEQDNENENKNNQ